MPTDINYSREDPDRRRSPSSTSLPPEEDLPDRRGRAGVAPLIQAMALGSEGSDYVPSTLTKLKTVVQPMVTITKADLAPIARKAADRGDRGARRRTPTWPRCSTTGGDRRCRTRCTNEAAGAARARSRSRSAVGACSPSPTRVVARRRRRPTPR